MSDIQEYKKVLVPFDGSEPSKAALELACSLRDVDSIHVINVFPVYEGDLELIESEIHQMLTGKGEEVLSAADEIASRHGRALEKGFLQGVPFEEITNYAENHGIDLIVMGRKGLSELERTFIGSVTQRVLGHTSKDVLVVPQGGSLKWEAPLLVAFDGTPSSEKALERAIETAKEYNSTVVVVHVIFTYGRFFSLPENATVELRKKGQEILEGVKPICGAKGVQCETILEEGEPHEGILRVIDRLSPGVVFVGSKGKGGLKKVFLGSVAEKVIGLSNVPVMVLKNY